MTLKELLYPPSCVFCGRINDFSGPCPSCVEQATELTATVCRRCGAYPEDCSCSGRQFAFTRNVSCFTYEKSARNLLLRYKMQYKPQLAVFIARRMFFHIRARLGEDFSCVVYVPQSHVSRMKRGFCPTQELGKRIAKQLKIPCLAPLKRISSMEQKYLSGVERWENAKKSYALRRNASVEGRVLLIDDHFTTGATLNACADLLLQAGAQEVFCATFTIDVKNS